MERKNCSLCKELKTLEEFNNSSRSKDGKRSQCKYCEAEYRKKVKALNEEFILKKCSTCGIYKTSDEFSKNVSQKDGYCNRCKNCVKAHYNENATIILNRNLIYRKNNRNKIAENAKRKYNEAYSTTIGKLRINISNRIRNCLIYESKSKTLQDILGCSIEEFKEHIESQFLNWMSWSNHGNICKISEYDCSWDLDHIIPISYAKNEVDVYLLNHWSNFQPLCSKVNRGRKNKNTYPVTNLELKITINN